jgi:hypothetical protein
MLTMLNQFVYFKARLWLNGLADSEPAKNNGKSLNKNAPIESGRFYLGAKSVPKDWLSGYIGNCHEL